MKSPEQIQMQENQIIELIRDGKANKEIAVIIQKSLPTVRVYISALLKKHNCKNRVQLALKNYTKVIE